MSARLIRIAAVYLVIGVTLRPVDAKAALAQAVRAGA